MENFIVSLEIMAKGMGAIFVAVLVITIVVLLVGKLK